MYITRDITIFEIFSHTFSSVKIISINITWEKDID